MDVVLGQDEVIDDILIDYTIQSCGLEKSKKWKCVLLGGP